MLNRILLIDDSEDMEYQVRNCANSMSADVILEMYDPRCGLPESSFNWSRYDLLLLDFDLGLSNQNGLDWLKQFKQNRKMPPVIMLTAYGTKKLKAEALARGADGFMEKDNLSPQIFSETVRNVLEIHGQRSPTQGLLPGDELTQAFSSEQRQKALGNGAKKIMDTGHTQEKEFEQTRAFTGEEIASLTGRHRDRGVGRGTTPAGTAAVSSVSGEKNAARARPVPEVARSTTARTPHSPAAARKTPSVQAPIVIPGYTIIRKIGEGGMASIYLAERDDDKLKVVLKVLSMQSSMYEPGLLRRFMREYKLIAQIQHPNIVQIYERAFASNFAYIAMEYFSYGDLAERLKTKIDTRTAINYLHQITEGLGAAHAQGIVHRDMKPANILFRSPDSLAITDFGIAKDVESENMVQKQLTMDGELMGTLYYISPEQILGAQADRRSDIYSLGVIMYKMLTGKHPYVGSSPTEVFEGHLNSPIPKLPAQFASLQPLLDGLLAKDPDERFQSTDDLLMGLNWQEWS
jgi:DNA-binding response OmpR family regulator/tRNA A-37 threonylcarbamoyl transferase component Bud32